MAACWLAIQPQAQHQHSSQRTTHGRPDVAATVQGVIEREKREQLQLLPLPQVFESLLSSEAQPPDPQPQNAPSDENPSDSTEPPPPGPVDVEMGPQSPSPVEREDMDGEGCGAGSLEAGAAAEEGTGRSSPDVAIEEFSFTFLGATFRCRSCYSATVSRVRSQSAHREPLLPIRDRVWAVARQIATHEVLYISS